MSSIHSLVSAYRKPSHRRNRSRLALEVLEDRTVPALVSHWTADNIALDAVGTNHGSLVSGSTYAPGQINQAFSFDGVNDRVQVVDSESLKLTASLTIEGWVRADSITPSGGVILFRGDDRGGLDPYSLSTTSAGMLQFQISSLIQGTSLSTPMPLGQFVHLAGTLDDATGAMRLYINGVLMSQTTTTVRPFGDLDPGSNPGIGIGNHGGYPTTPHNFPFDGLIDELKVYDHALSAADVLANFNAGKGSLQPMISISDATAVEGDSTIRDLGAFVSSGSGGLARPRHIAFGPDGKLYVASQDSSEVLRYDGTTGDFVDVVIPSSAGLLFARALDFGPDGNLYVSGLYTHNVLRYNLTTGLIDEFVSPGSGGLMFPKGLTFGPDGNLYVSSADDGTATPPDQVLRFNGITGAFMDIFVANGSGGLDNPNGLVFGPDGNLYVTSTYASNRVNRYDGTTGAFIDTFVAAGSGGLDVPIYMMFRNGELFVASQATNAVLVYDASTGAYLRSISGGGLAGPNGIDFDANGYMYVASAGTQQVLRYGPASMAAFTISLNAPFPTSVSVQYSTANGTALFGSDYEQTSGTVSFTPGMWSKTVLVPTLDDSAIELNETFSVELSSPVGAAIADGTGVGTIIDNDTKFYVVNDAGTNLTYEYGSGTGAAGESYALTASNTAPRGAASNAAGDKVWVVDANRNVYVYNPSGALLGSWSAGSMQASAQVEGIATNGTDIWLVDAKQDKVFRYTGAASRLSGSQNAASSFSLNSGNKNPKDIVTDGTSLWVVNDSTTDKVFKYTLAGSLQGSWTIDAANASPTGITLDPTNVNHLWIVDNGTDRVYQYDNAASRTSGSQSASTSFALAAGNTNPQGIADPPVGGEIVLPPKSKRPHPSAKGLADQFFSADRSLLATDVLQALVGNKKRRW